MAQPRRYYVFDDRIAAKLGDVPIQMFQGDRTVLMTDDKAKYFVDQGVIGLQKRSGPPPGLVTQATEGVRTNLADDAESNESSSPGRVRRRRRRSER